MINGITIKLINLIKTGVDSIGEPLYQEKEILIDNVLVAPVLSDDIPTSTDLRGKKIVYQLAIPKGDTNEWEDQFVEFFGHRYRTFNYIIQGIDENIPLHWNKKIMCERYE